MKLQLLRKERLTTVVLSQRSARKNLMQHFRQWFDKGSSSSSGSDEDAVSGANAVVEAGLSDGSSPSSSLNLQLCCTPASNAAQFIEGPCDGKPEHSSNDTASSIHRQPSAAKGPIEDLCSKGAAASSKPFRPFGRRASLAAPADGWIIWFTVIDDTILQSYSDGTLRLLHLYPSAGKADLIDTWRPSNLVNFAASTGVTFDNGSLLRAVISYDYFPEWSYDDDIVNESGDIGQSHSYLVDIKNDKINVVHHKPGYSDAVAFNGDLSLHGVFEGQVDYRVVVWSQNAEVRLVTAHNPEKYADVLQQEQCYAGFIAKHLVIVKSLAVDVYNLQSLQSHATAIGSASSRLEPQCTLHMSHPVDEGIVIQSPEGASGIATIIIRNSSTIVVQQLLQSPKRDQFRLAPVWQISIDPSEYLTALSIDTRSYTAYWISHDTRAAVYGCQEGASRIVSASLSPLSSTKRGAAPILQSIYEGSPGDALLHCDRMQVRTVNGTIMVSPRVCRRPLLLHGSVASSSSGVRWTIPAAGWDQEPFRSPSESERAEAKDSGLLECQMALRQFKVPSTALCSRPRVKVEGLPPGFLMDIDDLKSYVVDFPEGPLEALLRGYGVRTLPSLIAFKMDGDQVIMGHQVGDEDVFYQIAPTQAVNHSAFNDAEAQHGVYEDDLDISDKWNLAIWRRNSIFRSAAATF
ncbi:hypothetical protein CALCODRAFT_505469 [Calocera cornea HHB12733]|uniref:Uncharacterized protein n=1 Tax=Calocera cornea HHB12733 TaxID=1353952 RepID=A0A165K5M0_9BASI|nr:hypothetical protein CALCODRAFT_505469 [Calocera cornea HHB12733]